MARSRALLLVLVVSLLAQFVGGLPVVAAAAWTAGPTAPPWPAPDPMHGPVKVRCRRRDPRSGPSWIGCRD